jgi:hypothetical protein
VVLVLQPFVDDPRDQRPDAAELRVSERVARAGIRQQLAFRVRQPSETPMQQ